MIVMEWLSGRSLSHLLKTNRNSFSVTKRVKIGMDRPWIEAHARERAAAHPWEPRLIDFGLAKENVGLTNTMRRGTPQYMAPERFVSPEYGRPADVWSFGWVLWELLAWTPLQGIVKTTDASQWHRRVRDGYRPQTDGLLPCAKDIVERCWNQSPEARPTFADIVHECRERKWRLIEGVKEKKIADYVWAVEEFERIAAAG
jgi:serine/threonine protein kinase